MCPSRDVGVISIICHGHFFPSLVEASHSLGSVGPRGLALLLDGCSCHMGITAYTHLELPSSCVTMNSRDFEGVLWMNLVIGPELSVGSKTDSSSGSSQ